MNSLMLCLTCKVCRCHFSISFLFFLSCFFWEGVWKMWENSPKELMRITVSNTLGNDLPRFKHGTSSIWTRVATPGLCPTCVCQIFHTLKECWRVKHNKYFIPNMSFKNLSICVVKSVILHYLSPSMANHISHQYAKNMDIFFTAIYLLEGCYFDGLIVLLWFFVWQVIGFIGRALIEDSDWQVKTNVAQPEGVCLFLHSADCQSNF